jgi:hypothetical protein
LPVAAWPGGRGVYFFKDWPRQAQRPPFNARAAEAT